MSILFMNPMICKEKTCITVMPSGKTRLIEVKKEQALIRCCAFYAASDQSLNFLSQMSVSKNTFSHCLHNLNNNL